METSKQQYNSAPRRDDFVPKTLPPFDIKVLSKDLFDGIAQKCAEQIAAAAKFGDNINKSTQLRRFYDELVLWAERVGTSDEAYKNAEPFIYMIKSKVSYAKGRKTVDGVFLKFMNTLIDQIKDKQTLKNAKLFMEAVMGFYKTGKDK